MVREGARKMAARAQRLAWMLLLRFAPFMWKRGERAVMIGARCAQQLSALASEADLSSHTWRRSNGRRAVSKCRKRLNFLAVVVLERALSMVHLSRILQSVAATSGRG